ncbi:MAG TPA: Gldg family protein [Polyangia bacterium]|jgi:ABC-2 type transport system permease protein|nr:Gldg family protein [Polyangia bacterium]
MRSAAAIARRDFAAYFHSPAGLAIAALFLTLQGLVIWMFIQFLGRPDAPPGGVMEFFFGGTILYWIAVALLATVIPMRLIAEERRTGTIEPLLTAPVTAIDVVLGKWVAALAFYLALWAPTLLYLVYLRAIGAPLDPGPIASGYLGTVLIGAAALALGLMASSLTRNQIVAATLAFVSFFVLLLLGVLEGQVGDPRAGAVLRRLSLFRMMEDFGHGIVDSRHVVLLASLGVLALLAAVRAVAALRARPGIATPLLSLVIAVMVNYLAGRHYLRGDWTRARLYALSGKTVSVLRTLPRPVDAYVFLYPRRDSERARALGGMVRELCDRFTRYAPERFHVEIIDPDRNPARAEAMQKKYGIGAYEMGEGVVIFVAGGQSRFLTRDDLVDYDLEAEISGAPGGHLKAWKGEAAFVSALLTVTRDRPPTICFAQGHGEPDIESLADGGYATFAEEIRRDAYQIRAVERLGGQGPPADCDALAIVEPQRAYSDAEIAALDEYLARGGRMLLMLGPVFTHDGAGFAKIGLEALAQRWGIAIGDDLVVDPAHASDVEGPSVWVTSDYGGGATGAGSAGPGGVLARLAGRATVWPRTRQVRLAAAGAGTGEVSAGSGARWGRELVRCSDQGWAEVDLPTIRGEADLAFDPGRDRKGPVSVAAAIAAPVAPAAGAVRRPPAGGAQSRLVVLGTGRLVMNYRLAGPLVRDYDRDLVLSVIAWLTDREERAGIAPKVPEQVRLTLEASTVARAFQLFVVALPLGCLALAVLVWYRRRS